MGNQFLKGISLKKIETSRKYKTIMGKGHKSKRERERDTPNATAELFKKQCDTKFGFET